MKVTNKIAKMNGIDYEVFENENKDLYFHLEEGFFNVEWLKFVGNDIEIK